jgi:putative oxidoreductase
MLRKLFATRNDWTLTVLRLAAGVMIFAHGLQKTFGWFGGAGFTAQMEGFTQGMHIPAVFAFLAIMAEFLGGIGLLLGFLTRIAAFGVMCNMVVAVAILHWPNGFFMNWSGRQKGEGFEFHMLVVAMLTVVLIRGAGALSVDRAISARADEK